MRIVWWVVVVSGMAGLGCGDNRAGPEADAGADARIDAPPSEDPFVGMYDGPEDFPRTNCRPGAMAGFARVGIWIGLGLRTRFDGGALVTFRASFGGDEPVPHLLTDDDLFFRRTTLASDGRWSLEVMTICDVDADGTLRGSRKSCFGSACFPTPPTLFEEPQTHRIVGEAEGSGLALLGEVRVEDRALNVRVADGVAYLAMGSGGLRTVSVADPRAPVLLGRYWPNANYYNDVKLLEAGGRRYAVMGGGAPADVIDVTDPRSPQLVAQMPTYSHTLAVEDGFAYLVGGRDFVIYDLANPRVPVLLSQTRLGNFHDLYVANGTAYVSDIDRGVVVIDCLDPSAPIVVGQTELEPGFRYWHSPWLTRVAGRPILAHGDEGRGSGLRLLDAAPASPTYLDTLGEWHLRDQVSIHNVMAFGARVFAAHYQDGVRVIDIADPAAPAMIGYFNTWREDDATAGFFGGAIGIDVDLAARRIYVADTIRGLMILEGTPALFP